MNTAVIIGILITIFIAFVATIVTAIVKAVFFFQYYNVYEFLLRFGLIGELVGVGVSTMLFALRKGKSVFVDDAFIELVLSIPFYTMLTGLAYGVITVYRRKHKFRKRLL